MPPRFSELLCEILHRSNAIPAPEKLAGFSLAEWRAFTAEAIRFRLAYQVYCFLAAEIRLASLVPPECLSDLRSKIRATLIHNLGQQRNFRNFVGACDAEGIPVILLKGLWLSETTYREQKARPTGDIDLLFRPEDMPRLTAMVKRLGFAVAASTDDLAALDPLCNEHPLQHPSGRTLFDIHWSLTHPIQEEPIDQDLLWRRARTYSIAGGPCQSLGVEDHLLYVCFHAAEHHRFDFVGPRALLDVACLLERPPQAIDWSDLVERALDLGWSRSAWIMLTMARDYLGSEVPAWVLPELNPDLARDQALPRAALEAIFLTQNHGDRLADNVVRLLKMDSWIDRLSLLRERLFPGRQQLERYFEHENPTHSHLRLRLKHWTRMLNEHAPGLLQVASGSSFRKAELKRTVLLNNWLDGRSGKGRTAS